MSNQQNQLPIFDLVAFEEKAKEINQVKFIRMEVFKVKNLINRLAEVYQVSKSDKTLKVFCVYDFNKEIFNLVLSHEYKDVILGFEKLGEYGVLFSSKKEILEYLKNLDLRIFEISGEVEKCYN